MTSKSDAYQEGHIDHDSKSLGQVILKLDRNGLPLVPQPSDHKDDPLNWPIWARVYIVFMVSSLGFIMQMGSALINPAYVQMSADLDITVEQASYCTTVFILFSGIFPMFIVPFSNVYGRRIVYMTFTLIAIAANIGSGAAATYGGVIAGRVFYGIGGSIPLGIGAATVSLGVLRSSQLLTIL